MAENQTSQVAELLLAIDRGGSLTLGVQIEDQVRTAIRNGALRPAAGLPSTRDLARQLGVSRGVVVDAYAQLAAEGYLLLRQGARPRVLPTAATIGNAGPRRAGPPRARFDFRPSVPDVSLFPRAAWTRSLRHAVASITDRDLSYGDHRGTEAMRTALAEYLGRVRGVVADPANVVVTCGYAQGLGLVCRSLVATGASTVAFEAPTWPEQVTIAEHAGLRAIPVPVDADGIRVDALARAAADAVVLTPAHQHPLGVALSGERRTELLAWLRARGAIAIEDDYDAEFRYDRAAVGALQGLAPDHVVYAGSTSKTLAPALRLGWLVVPPRLQDGVAREKLLADRGTARIEQLAFADFVTRGELDRHLRRMRTRYRARRDTLVEALAQALPEATVRGIAAGLHAVVEIPAGHDERAIAAEARLRGIELETLLDFWPARDGTRPTTIMLGYAPIAEAAIRSGVAELAAAVRAAG